MALDFSVIDEELKKQGVDPERVGRLLNFSGTANAAPASATAVQPGTRDYNLRVGATNQPRLNFSGPRPGPESVPTPEMGTPPIVTPPSGGNRLNFGAAPTPMKPAAPTREDFPVEKRSMWKNLLGGIFSVMAGARDPNEAGATARQFFGGPKAEAEKKFQRASEEYKTEDERGKEQRAEAAQAEKEQFATPQGREQYMAQNPDRFAGITDFEKNDWVLSGKFPQREPQAAQRPEVHDTAEGPIQYNPESKQWERVTVGGQPVGPKKQELDKKIDEFVNPQGQRVNVMQRPDGTTYNAPRGEVRPEAGQGKTQDIKDIADGIVHGIDPPDMTKYGYRDRTAIAAELKRQGFDLARAQQDWTATQKHLSTLNGAQQERLRQAITFTNDSLGIIQDLYSQWKATGLPSGFKIYNRAALAASSNLPGRAGSVAQRLMAQINDLTSELGTVYKGGNTSTDESLRLAAENLKAEWNDRTFTDALAQVRKNLQIRQNSITHSQPAGVSANSPYTPPAQRGGAGDFGAAPAGKAEGSTGTLPDGTKVVIRGGRIVAQ